MNTKKGTMLQFAGKGETAMIELLILIALCFGGWQVYRHLKAEHDKEAHKDVWGEDK